MEAFLNQMMAEGRDGSVKTYGHNLNQFNNWLTSMGLDPLRATKVDLQAYQRYLSDEYRKADGSRLSVSSQARVLAVVVSYYKYLEQRTLILSSPARELKIPMVPKGVTAKDHLDLQEATALIQTQARRVVAEPKGSKPWALEHRNLAMLCLALATGRRSKGLLTIKLGQLDLLRRELRVDREKGRPGRVLPVITWATDVCRLYLKEARPLLLEGRKDRGWLFPGTRNERASNDSFANALNLVHRQTVEENPDLEALARKHLSPHCLRVSFATLLFKGGCDIRSVNELMLHTKLSTTARYTPIPLEDLRRVCRLAHPRA